MRGLWPPGRGRAISALMNRFGLACLLCMPACRDRGQDVTGGGWAGTPIEQRGRFQAERESAQPAGPASAPETPPVAPTSEAPRPPLGDAAGGSARAAIGLLDRPLAAADVTTDMLLTEARQWAAEDNLTEARAAVARAKLRDPESPAVLLVDGWLLARTGEHRAAVRAYDLVLRQRPDSDEALYGKALAHLALNDRAIAAPLVEQLRERRPNDPKIQRLATRLAPENRKLLASAQAAATGDPAAVREHADALLDAGRPQEAVEFYAMAAVQRRDDIDLHLRWGLTLAALDRAADADAPLTRVTELAPDRSAAWQSLAAARESRGDVAGAIAAWQGLLARTPGPAAEPIRKQIARLQSDPRSPKE